MDAVAGILNMHHLAVMPQMSSLLSYLGRDKRLAIRMVLLQQCWCVW